MADAGVEPMAPAEGEIGPVGDPIADPPPPTSDYSDVTRKKELILQYTVPLSQCKESNVKDLVESATDCENLVPFVFIEKTNGVPTGKIKIHFVDGNAKGLWLNCDPDLMPADWELHEPDVNAEHRGPCHIVVYGVPAGVTRENFLAEQHVVRPNTFEHVELFEKETDGVKTCTAFMWFIGGIRTINARKAFAKGIHFRNVRYEHRRRDIPKRDRECKHTFYLCNTPADADGRRTELALKQSAKLINPQMVSRDVHTKIESRAETMGTGCIKINTNSLIFIENIRSVITSEEGLILNSMRLAFWANEGEYWADVAKNKETASKPPPPLLHPHPRSPLVHHL